MWKRTFGAYADSEGPDQTAHSRSLIMAFAVRLQNLIRLCSFAYWSGSSLFACFPKTPFPIALACHVSHLSNEISEYMYNLPWSKEDIVSYEMAI